MELIVTTFNLRVHVEQDGDNAWPKRFSEAAEAIKEADAAIVCTQEATFAMLHDLQKILPAYSWIGEGRKGGHEDEHCAIFYRKDMLEPIESGHFGLSEFPERLGYVSWASSCPRMCTWVRMRRTDGHDLYVFNTHLDHVSEEARTNGIRLIIDRLQELTRSFKIPAFLAGDFNCEPDSEVISILNRAGLLNAFSEHSGKSAETGRTYHGYHGGEAGEPIDYIFVTPDIRVASVNIDRRLYNGRYPSDHYPVTVNLVF